MKSYNVTITAQERELFATLFELALKAHGGQIIPSYQLAMHKLMTAPEVQAEPAPARKPKK